MNNFVNKYKHFAAGMIIGCIVGVGTLGYAASAGPISAWIKEGINIEFNGEKKELPKDDKVILYENKAYLPAWFVAENLGATVEWNESRKTILINTKNTKKNEDIEVQVPSDDYQTLPVQKVVDNVLITVNDISIDTDETRIYLKVKNIGEEDILIDQTKTKVILDKKVYDQRGIVNKVLYPFDHLWYKNIGEDDEVEGVVKVMPLRKDTKNATIILKMIQNDGSGKEWDLKFNITIK